MSVDDANIGRELKDLFYWDFPLVNEEEIGESEDNRRAIKMLKESIRFDGSFGKYVVALPWRHGRENAAQTLASVDSKAMAIRRLCSMIPRLRRDEARKLRVFEHM